MLLEGINALRPLMDQANDGLQNEIKEAEARVTGRVEQLSSELRGEQGQASRVDARGLGPIALGIVLTGLPDELASIASLGYAAIAVSILWVALAFPSWLRDYRQAPKSFKD